MWVSDLQPQRCLHLCWKARGWSQRGPGILQDATGAEVHGVCAGTTMLQCIHVSGLYSSEELVTTALCPCREQTVPCNHLSPRRNRGWLRNCTHPFLHPPAMAASGAHPHRGGEPSVMFFLGGVPTGNVFFFCAALRVCKSKSICLDASYDKQSAELVKRKVKIDVTNMWRRVSPSSKFCWISELRQIVD